VQTDSADLSVFSQDEATRTPTGRGLPLGHRAAVLDQRRIKTMKDQFKSLCIAEAIDLMEEPSEKQRRRDRYARRRAKVAKIRQG
jgi:hypothetical protein